MKKSVFIIGLVLLIPFFCWSQGKITRQKKTEPAKKEAPKTTQKAKKTTSNPSKTISKQNPSSSPKTSLAPDSTPTPTSIPTPPVYTFTETINGITVRWNGVTASQKSVITTLLNNMVYVPGGSFMMGSGFFDNAKPVHRETVSSFQIDKYEVTQKLWQVVMGNNPSSFKGENLPVENVSWDECQDFIKKLNSLTGLSFRMPTEAEWEYAARGGNLSNRYQYSGSNIIDIVGWYSGNSENKTHPVGTNLHNELGLYDMSGNVWEWTSDKYSSNYNSPRNSSYYVYRGGGWNDYARFGTCVTFRSSGAATYRNNNLGFRLVL